MIKNQQHYYAVHKPALQDGGLHLQGEGLNLQSLSLGVPPQGSAQLSDGHLSDTTASAPGSDDEGGSNAATDGSNLR